MAGFNEITLARWQNLVRRFFGLVGPGGNMPLVTPEISPIVVLEPDTYDKRWLRGETSWYDQINVSGAAVSKVKLRNALASNRLVIIERVRAQFRCFSDVAAGVRIGINGPAGSETDFTTTAGNSVIRDLRPLTNVQPALIASSENSVGAPAVFTVTRGYGITGAWRDDAGSAEAIAWDIPPAVMEGMVMPPGSALYLYGSQTNGELTVEVHWYERNIEQSERG